MRDMVTVSFRCSRNDAAALERAGTAEVLRQLVATWAEMTATEQFVDAYEKQPVDAEGQVRSAVPDKW